MFFLIAGLFVGALILLVAALTWVVARLLGRRWGRSIRRLALYSFLVAYPLVTFLVAPLALARLLSAAGTRPQDLRLQLDPESFGCSFEEANFTSRDGARLSGWWMPGEPDRETFVIAHGLFRDRKEVTERGCRLRQQGHGVLVFDLRGHGGSERRPVTLGYQERLDVLAAAGFVRGIQSSPLVVMGVSMGAAASLMAVAEMVDPPAAVVADSSFTSLRDTVRRHTRLFVGAPGFPFADLFVWSLTRLGGFSARDFDLPRVLTGATAWPPTLLIYGSLDERMPEQTARVLFDSLPTSRKALVFFEEAGHGDAWEVDPDRYLAEIERFLKRQRHAAVDELPPHAEPESRVELGLRGNPARWEP